jgi:hypothetical protein
MSGKPVEHYLRAAAVWCRLKKNTSISNKSKEPLINRAEALKESFYRKLMALAENSAKNNKK